MSLMEMSQLLGNFGEFVGAIAVVATLGYLAYQIKQNTKTMKSNAYREVSRLWADHNWDVARDRDLAELTLSQYSETDLGDPIRKYQSAMSTRAYLLRVELLYNEVEMGIGPQDKWEVIRGLTRTFLDIPNVRELWEEEKAIYGKDFVGELDSASPGMVGIVEGWWPSEPKS